METVAIIICAVVVIVAAVAAWFAGIAYRKNIAEAKIGKAEDKARDIIDEALRDAESKKRDILLTAKEEALKTKNDIEKEVKDRRSEIQHMEKRVLQREENLDKLLERMDEMGVDKSGIDWYLDTRRYGGCVHSGFGMGFERLIMYLTGVENIRDVIPYPRTPNNCEF